MRTPRGQNMVLLALTMLLVTVMVTMTIGLGLRIRQKQELQNLADAAAFSNAVATARVFNSAALTNRVEVSYWVAQAADESLISWTGYARAMTTAAEQAAQRARDDCETSDGGTGGSADFGGFKNDVANYRSTTLRWADWSQSDTRAGEEAQSIQGQVGALRDYIQRSITDLDGVLDCNGARSVTRRVIMASGLQSTVTCEPLAVQVTRKEVFSSSVGYEGTANPGLKSSADGEWNVVMREAAMGTRGGAPFLTLRGVVPSGVAGALASLASSNGVQVSNVAPTGSGYWARPMNHGTDHNGFRAWADDHGGSVTVSGGGCSGTSDELKASVMSSAEQFTDDVHDWEPNNGPEDFNEPHRHTMGPYSDPDYPGVWVPTPSFLPGAQGDAWGQPKLMVALRRNLLGTRFPWELEFNLGNGAKWDGRLANRREQAAYATAMVYYHHHSQGGVSGWQEFPNLLNPFWRATLVAADIDGSPKQVSSALPGTPWNALLDNGYKGIH